MAIITQNHKLIKEYLMHGDIVGIPTETVYGLAGNALDRRAIDKIYKVKNRPYNDPLIVHVDSIKSLSNYVLSIPDAAYTLASAFWPGPLTLLFEKKDIIPNNVTSGMNRVAIRIPDHPLTIDLLAELPFPLAAPSANPFGYISPTEAAHVNAQLGSKISAILDGGKCRIGLESTIIGFEEEQVVIYRQGGITMEQLSEVVPGILRMEDVKIQKITVPGMVKKHYSPLTPIVCVDPEEITNVYDRKRIGALRFKNYTDQLDLTHQVLLSPAGDLAEAAFNFYAGLRKLDSMGLELIVAEAFPNMGLGRTMNERLLRAISTA